MPKVILTLILGTMLALSVIIIRAYTFESPITKESSAFALPIINSEAAAQNLGTAIRFKTIASSDDNLEFASEFLAFHDFLRTQYKDLFEQLEVTEIPPFGLIIKWPGRNTDRKPILLMAHQDVVPIAPGSEDKWSHEPFSGDIENGAVYGRGALDDKGSVIGIMEAVSYLLLEKFIPDRTVYIFLGDSEEIVGSTAPKAAQYFKDNNVHFEAVFDEGYNVYTDGFAGIDHPIALIGVAEKGYLDLELSSHTKPGHSSTPPTDTVIGVLADAVSKLQNHRWFAKINNTQMTSLEILGLNMGFANRLIMTNSWLFEPVIIQELRKNPRTFALITTTMAPTIFNAGVKSNVLPSNASVTINFRINPGETADLLVQTVKNVINDEKVSYKILAANDPSPISGFENGAFQKLAKTINAVHAGSNAIIAPSVFLAATDSRAFTGVSENQYRFLPYKLSMTDLEGPHGTNEHLSIENLEKLIQFYVVLVKEMNESK